MTQTNLQANKQIARNTVFLYIRKILTLFIALYTSRVLLQTLGIDDFGLYGLIGSIVILFNSLRGLFASSIQRFLNIEKSSSDECQNRIFAMGVSIHIGIAILFFVVVEIAGLIMIPNLNLGTEKISVAYIVLQFSILASVVSILTVPYDALMMAKERFDAIAGFSLLDSVMRLVIIYLLTLAPSHRLVFYSILVFGVSLLIRLVNAIYCKRQFPSISKYWLVRDRKLFKEMTKFAGWNFFGNLGYSLTNQGLNFVLNLFGGVVANAARTIAYQVNNNMRSFVVDIAVAFTPQSMMAYKENKARFYNLQFFSAKASSAIFLVFAFPMYLLTVPVLKLWLGECPEYSVAFIHGIFFYSMVRNWHGPIDIAFKSANRMQSYQICEIAIMVMNLPLSWLCLHLGAPLYSIFVVMTIIEVINMIAILLIGKRQIDFPIWEFIKAVVAPTCGAIIIFIIGYFAFYMFDFDTESIMKLLLWCSVLALIALAINIIVVFNPAERAKLFEIIKIKKRL